MSSKAMKIKWTRMLLFELALIGLELWNCWYVMSSLPWTLPESVINVSFLLYAWKEFQVECAKHEEKQ